MHYATDEFRRLGLLEARSIKTYTSNAELAALHSIAKGLAPGSSALEVGSYLGASANFIAAGLSDPGILYCVDTWQNQTMPEGELDTFQAFKKNTANFTERIRTIRKRSDELNPGDITAKVAFAFIDGDHSYEAAKADFKRVEPLVDEAGIIAFHDSTSYEGVSQVVGELLSTGKWRIVGMVETLIWIHRAEWDNFLTRRQKGQDL